MHEVKPGAEIGRIRVLYHIGRHPRYAAQQWQVRCACGTEYPALYANIRAGKVTRCRFCRYPSLRRPVAKPPARPMGLLKLTDRLLASPIGSEEARESGAKGRELTCRR